MIDKIHFSDNNTREFVPYKGWIKENCERDELTMKCEKEEDSKIVVHELSHGNFHTTLNLKKDDGNLLLSKGVRNIEWIEDGFYMIKDNNEDELINKYNNIPVEEYTETYQVANREGNLIAEEYFDKVHRLSNKAIVVQKGDKQNILLLTGKFLLSHYVDFICNYYKNNIYFVDHGVLYSSSYDGEIKKCKELTEISTDTYYSIRRPRAIGFSSKEAILKEFTPLNTGVHLVYLLSEQQGEAPMNIIINGRYLLFDKWHRDIKQKSYGPYFITSRWNSYLANASGEVIKELGYFKIIVSDELYSVTNQNNSFQIYNNNYELVDSDFTSIMWSDEGIWGIHTLSTKSHNVYLNGEANEILTYAHEILISKKSIALFEKKGIWYYIDQQGILHECFRNYKLNE